MFTVEQIEKAHGKVKSGADFPKYIQEIKALGVEVFETWVKDSHTVYFGADGYKTQSMPQYATLPIASTSDRERFASGLKIHQQGGTDYRTFCSHCAETGIEKWRVNLVAMTCTYYDTADNEIVTERIPE
jgi:uncharacterized protein YbcV (DUF1398 family)